ncbi:hypothetical protein CRM79_17820 [Pantoea agglomerans]|nr:hypothetical protein CRM79_17820 [Pantoea agglomerans]
MALLRAHLRDEVRTRNAGSVFEQRNALALLRAHLRDEVRTKNAGAFLNNMKCWPGNGYTSGMRCVIARAGHAMDGSFCLFPI